MTRVLFGLGSNLGDRRAHLRRALDSIAGDDVQTVTPGLEVRVVSDVYETEPVGGPEQDDFLNLVVLADDPAPSPDPFALLRVCQLLEAQAARTRTVRWGPRTLDVDLLWIDGVTVDEPDLVVPHPRTFERRFVLQPMADVAPDLVPEGALTAPDDAVVRLGPLR